MKQIIIVLDGGLIQEVISKEPLEALIIDYDTEGADPQDVEKDMFGIDCYLDVVEASLLDYLEESNWDLFKGFDKGKE